MGAKFGLNFLRYPHKNDKQVSHDLQKEHDGVSKAYYNLKELNFSWANKNKKLNASLRELNVRHGSQIWPQLSAASLTKRPYMICRKSMTMLTKRIII